MAEISRHIIEMEGWHPEWLFNGLQLRQSYNDHHIFEISVLIPHPGLESGGKKSQQAISQDSLTRILGKKVVLTLHSKEKSTAGCRFEGFVDQVAPVWTSRACVLRVIGYSPTMLMDCIPSFRTFYKKQLSEIVNKITGKYGSAIPRVHFSGAGGTTDFSVQGQETDYRYLCRLADEHGKVFYYDGENLHFGELETQEQSASTAINFGADLKQAGLSLNIAPLNFQLAAFNLGKSEMVKVNAPVCQAGNPLVRETISKSQAYPSAALHLFNLGGEHAALNERAKRLQSKQAHDLVRFQGSSNLPSLRIGSRISIKNTREVFGQGDYIILEVNHHVSSDFSYSNTFTAIPAGFPFLPRMLNSRSPLCGPVMATVKDHDDPEKIGRVRVEFVGDEEKTRSPWLRVLTPFTGFGGMYCLPEPGDMVVVQSEDQNLEKSAFVSGAFYHGKASAEQWHDPKNKKKGFCTEKVSFKIDDHTGKLTIEADEIEIKARKTLKTKGKSAEHNSETDMKIKGGNHLTMGADRIDLN